MFVEIIALTDTVNVLEIVWLIANLIGMIIVIRNLRVEHHNRATMIEDEKYVGDEKYAADENIRRQVYKFWKMFILLSVVVFFCTQPGPRMQSIPTFIIQMVSILFVFVISIDSYKDMIYQKKFVSSRRKQ